MRWGAHTIGWSASVTDPVNHAHITSTKGEHNGFHRRSAIPMTVPATKRINVTFKEGMPLGYRGNFTYDNRNWIAIPLVRYSQLATLVDRLCNIFSNVNTDMVRIINDHPEDARRCLEILDQVAKGRELHRKFIEEKARVNE